MKTRWGVVIVLYLLKFLFITTIRMMYPYASFFATSLNITFPEYFYAIGLQEIAGSLVILFGPTFELMGSEAMVITAVILNSSFCIIFGSNPSYTLLLVSRFICGFSRSLLESGAQLLVGLHYYDNLGKATGIMELSWGSSSLIGIPLAGVFIYNIAWQAPFYIFPAVSLCLLPVAAYVFVSESKVFKAKKIPKLSELHPVTSKYNNSVAKSIDITRQKLSAMFLDPVAVLSLFAIFFNSLAINIVFSNYGIWLVERYELNSQQLGTFSLCIGVGEVVSEVLVILISEKWRIEASITVASFICTLMYLVLAVVAYASIYIELSGATLFVLFIAFEYVTVVSISRAPIVFVKAQELFIAFFFGSIVIGFFVGALISAWVYSLWNLVSTALISGGFSLITLLCMVIIYKLSGDRIAAAKKNDEGLGDNNETAEVELLDRATGALIDGTADNGAIALTVNI